MELRDILSNLKTENGLTTDVLSRLSGVPKGTLNKLLNGETRNPTGTTLRKIADALHCPVEVLYGRANQSSVRRISEEGTAFEYNLPPEYSGDLLCVHRGTVPVLKDASAQADESGEFAFCDDAPPCDFALRVQGDGMAGARILDGDIVFIQKQNDVKDGEIAAVVLNGEIMLKRVYHIRNGLQLLSENPKYPPLIFMLEECDAVRILGRATGFQSRL